jgi:hypothetical protein
LSWCWYRSSVVRGGDDVEIGEREITAVVSTGLWLIHQLCSNVTLGTDDHGFSIRLLTGAPEPRTAPDTTGL